MRTGHSVLCLWRSEDDVVGGVRAVLDMGCTCLDGYCFCFVVGGVKAGSEGDPFFSSSWVLDVDSGTTISDCVFSRAVSVDVSPVVLRITVLDVFHGVGLLLSAAL